MGQNYETTIGGFIFHRRHAARMTQRELCDLAGVGTRFLSEIERNKASARLDVVNRVLAVFGKSLGIVDAPSVEVTEQQG